MTTYVNGEPVMSSFPEDSVHITLTGFPSMVSSPSSGRYTASVPAGSPGDLYYRWYRRDCYYSYDCVGNPSEWSVVQEGSGLRTITEQFSGEGETNLVAVVSSASTGKTGTSRQFVIIGGGAASGSSYAGCGIWNDVGYPHIGIYTDPVTGQTSVRHFGRRTDQPGSNSCGGKIVWE